MLSEIRALRLRLGLSQEQFAARLSVPTETFRTRDSGRRPTPAPVLQRAKHTIATYINDTQLLPLKQLAIEFGVHVRTLRAAANKGKLLVHLSKRSAFGRPIRCTTRKEVQRFNSVGYGRSGAPRISVVPLPRVPTDYDGGLLDNTSARRIRHALIFRRRPCEEYSPTDAGTVHRGEIDIPSVCDPS